MGDAAKDRPAPWRDVAAFLQQPGWATVALWALLAIALIVALVVLKQRPGQRSGRDVGIALLRVVVGCMWWQQSLWKIPPNYGGLLYWMKQMVDHASTALQSDLVATYVIPHIDVFGPLVYGVEVVIAVALIIGAATRLAGLLGLLMALNLWLGLYSAPGEWPWSYAFLVVIQGLFVIDPPGHSLGVDRLLAAPFAAPAPVGEEMPA